MTPVEVQESARVAVVTDRDDEISVQVGDSLTTVLEIGTPGPKGTGEPGPPGRQGEPGPAGTDQAYTHNQIIPSATWNVEHTLTKPRPSVTVVDSAGTTVEGEIQFVSDTRITISFTAPFAGYAYLN
jgi:hypothetical protein